MPSGISSDSEGASPSPQVPAHRRHIDFYRVTGTVSSKRDGVVEPIAGARVLIWAHSREGGYRYRGGAVTEADRTLGTRRVAVQIPEQNAGPSSSHRGQGSGTQSVPIVAVDNMNNELKMCERRPLGRLSRSDHEAHVLEKP